MNKYNEIMNRVTVDPEMKIRVMDAVASAIREQAKENDKAVVSELPRQEETEAPVRRKKASKVPIAIFTTLAAGILVFLGVMFAGSYLSRAKSASETVRSHNDTANAVSNEINSMVGETAATTAAFFGYDSEAEETENDKTLSGNTAGGDYSINDDREFFTTPHTKTTETKWEISGSEVIGDERIDRISKALPFDISGNGKGTIDGTITQEVFFGVNGQKVLLFTAAEGTDILGILDRDEYSAVSDGTSPDGIALHYYCITCGNVEVAEGTAEINAAVFAKNGQSYVLIFTDVQSQEVIGRVADAV